MDRSVFMDINKNYKLEKQKEPKVQNQNVERPTHSLEILKQTIGISLYFLTIVTLILAIEYVPICHFQR